MNGSSNSAQDSALLTAYLLGELDDAATAAVEARAATDLDFAELRDRLASTIDLVRSTLVDTGAVERLSPTHRDALRHAASRRTRVVYRPVRSALAASVLIGIGCALYRERPPQVDSTLADNEVLVARVLEGVVREQDVANDEESRILRFSLDTASSPMPANGLDDRTGTSQESQKAPEGAPPVVPPIASVSPASGSTAGVELHYKNELLGRGSTGTPDATDRAAIRVEADRSAKSVANVPTPPPAEFGMPQPAPSSPPPPVKSLDSLHDGLSTQIESQVDLLTLAANSSESARNNGTPELAQQVLRPGDNAVSPSPLSVNAGRKVIPMRQVPRLLVDSQVVAMDGLTPSGNDIAPMLLGLETSNRGYTVEDIRRSCERQPGERPRDMYYRFFQDNAFERAATAPLSTFAADVDTASYALARKYLENGYLPEKAQVRTEEFLNWFAPDVAAPTTSPLAVALDLGPSVFGGDDSNRRILRVVLRSRDAAKDKRPPQRLMLVIDTSGSMAEQSRLELVKHQLRLLTAALEERDEIGLVRFADDASLVLPMTRVSDRVTIERAIHALAPEGSTNACAGLRLGCATLTEKLDREATNHVVLFSDGVANTGTTDAGAILSEIAEHRKKNLYLSTIGVGMNNHNDALLERLADAGDGSCAYVDSEEEAKRAIVDRFSGAFVPVARDVKIQLEFDAGQIERYRLIGYENRPIADADFRNDAVDAGEIGANTQVTALYEIEPTAQYGKLERPFAKANIRWLPPLGHGDTASEASSSASAPSEATSFDAATPGFRRAVLVAQFAEFLRRSSHAENDSFDRLLTLSRDLAKTLSDGEFDQFVTLLERSRDLILSSLDDKDPLRRAIDAVRRNAVLRAEIEDAAKGEADEILKQIEAENRRLEELLKKLLGEAR